MLTETISIEVAPEIARFYNDASPEERKKLDLLFEVRLLKQAGANRDKLRAAMDEMQRQARENGLTPEILESILEDE